MTLERPPMDDVFGVGISLCSVDQVSRLAVSPPAGEATVVVICNVHSVMTARKDQGLAQAIGRAEIVTPDGMPLVWALRAAGHGEARRVTGIDVMTRSLELGPDRGARHFFYGSTPEVLAALVARVESEMPEAKISGSISPPFRELTEPELDDHLRKIRDSGTDVVWVGLGMPKQEMWMDRVRDRLPGITLVGVGAAFDWYAGNTPRAPRWMQDAGLEWAYRLLKDPRRLWRRYVFNNPAFLALLARRWFGAKARRLGGERDA